MVMIKVRALKQFSSMVFGGVSPGEVIEIAEGYVKDMITWGMVERIGDAPAAVVVSTPPVVEPAPVALTVDPFTAALNAAIASAPKKRGGRPKGSRNR